MKITRFNSAKISAIFSQSNYSKIATLLQILEYLLCYSTPKWKILWDRLLYLILHKVLTVEIPAKLFYLPKGILSVRLNDLIHILITAVCIWPKLNENHFTVASFIFKKIVLAGILVIKMTCVGILVIKMSRVGIFIFKMSCVGIFVIKM